MRGLPMQQFVLATFLTLLYSAAKVKSSHVFTPDERQKIFSNVEANLLSLFDFEKPTKPASNIMVSEQLLKLYESMRDMDADTPALPKPGIHTKTANTVRGYTHVVNDVDRQFPGHNRFRLFFDIRKKENETLKAAELSLNRGESYSTENQTAQQVSVYDIVRPGVRGKSAPIQRLIDTRMVDLHRDDPVNLDVLPAVQRWMENPRSNHGLLIVIKQDKDTETKPHVRIRRDVDESEGSWLQKQPFLYTYTDDGKEKQRKPGEFLKRRSKRADHRKKSGSRACKRHSLYVSFKQVGWEEWIIAPRGYDAFYCHGECSFPLGDHMNATNHAIVQTLIHDLDAGSVPRACCVPTKLSELYMLYKDNDTSVVLKKYRNMVVEGCGCR